MEKEKRLLGWIRAHVKAEMKRKIDDAEWKVTGVVQISLF